MEDTVFHVPAVAAELQKVVEARLHNDGDEPDYKAWVKTLQRRMAGTTATPTYVLLDPESERILGVHEGPEIHEPPRFAEWLSAARRLL